MSVLIPVVTAAGAWYYAAHTLTLRDKARTATELATQNYEKRAPLNGYYGSFKDYLFAPMRGRFRTVMEDIDVNGAKTFLVDYGNGQKVVQYHDPRIEL